MVVAAADDAEADRAFVRSPTFCEQVKLASQTLIGITETAMSHGEAWHFSRIGRLIERADKTSRIVDVQYFLLLPNLDDVGSSLDVVRWSASAEVGQRSGNVPSRAWSDYPGQRRRLS